jgi:hypothetical protein
LLNWLDERAKCKEDQRAIENAYKQDTSLTINNLVPPQQGWSQQQGKYQGNYYNSSNTELPPLRELISEQARINDNLSNKIVSNDKILESINAKIDTFSSTIKEQLNFNKKIEIQIAQLSAALLVFTNPEQVNKITTRGGKSTQDPQYPKWMSKRTKAVPVIPEEDEVEDVTPQEPQEMRQDFHDTNFIPFPCRRQRAHTHG